jgi:hypothetical protein
MDAKEYLQRVEDNECIIANKQIEKQYWIDLATGITSGMGGERVQATKTSHPMESKLVEASLIDDEIKVLKAEIKEVINTIQLLPRWEYDILYKVYVQHKPIKVASIDAKKSYSWGKAMHNKALNSLQKILDDREKAEG